jgi:hypothetical protein
VPAVSSVTKAGMNLAPPVPTDMASSILDISVLSGCRVCGWATLPGSTLCVGCLDIREWSRVNRAFCELLHRTHSIDRLSGHREIYAPARFALTV